MDAGDASFVPGDDTVWDAYWLLIGADEVPGLFEAHLIEDEWSPSGYCFACDAYKLVRGCWEWSDGGRYWDFSGADQLLCESLIDYSQAVPLEEDGYRAQWETPWSLAFPIGLALKSRARLN